MRILLLALATALATLAPLAAQDAPPEDSTLAELKALLDTRVEVSSTAATTIFSAPSTVSIIDRETIERFGFLSLSETLETVAGIYMSRPLWNRNLPTSRGVLQESYANRMLLLIDGVASWNTLTGDLNLDRVDIQDVERIEVLRGPASVLYGTNAYAGAINVILRRDARTTTRGYGGIEDQGGSRFGASQSLALHGFRLFASANRRHELGETVSVTGDDGAPFTMAEENEASNANVRLHGHGLTLQANAYRQEATWFGAANTFRTGGGTQWENTGYFLHGGYEIAPVDVLKLRYSLTYDSSGKESPVSLSGMGLPDRRVGLRQKGYRLSHVLSGTWDVTKGIALEVGGTTESRVNQYYARYDNLTGEDLHQNNLEGRKLREDSLYAQLGVQTGPVNVLLGSRRTWNEAFGANTSSRVSAVLALSETSSVKAIFGQSFRAPAYLEGWIDFGTVLGNEDLRPERSDSWELGYTAALGNVFVQVLAFHSTFKDKIYRAIYTTNVRKYANAPTFKATGVELELKAEIPKIARALLNVDYTTGNSGDEVDHAVQYGYNYRMVPKWGVTAGLSREVAGFTGSLLANYQSANDGPRGPVDDRGVRWETVPAWIGVDASLSYTHPLGPATLRHLLTFKNLFDDERWSPEATRRNVNRLPFMEGRRASYVLSAAF